MRGLGLPVAAILVAVLAGCGPSGGQSSAAEGHPASFAGTAWQLVSIGGQPLPAGHQVTLDFNVDRLAGMAPCNSYAGAVAYNHDTGALAVAPLISTKRACVDPAGSDLESAYLEALQGATEATIDASGRLSLASPGAALVFVATARSDPGAS